MMTTAMMDGNTIFEQAIQTATVAMVTSTASQQTKLLPTKKQYVGKKLENKEEKENKENGKPKHKLKRSVSALESLLIEDNLFNGKKQTKNGQAKKKENKKKQQSIIIENEENIKKENEEDDTSPSSMISPVTVIPFTSDKVLYNENLIEGSTPPETKKQIKKLERTMKYRSPEKEIKKQQQDLEENEEALLEALSMNPNTWWDEEEEAMKHQVDKYEQKKETVKTNGKTTRKQKSTTEGLSDKDFSLVSFLLSKLANTYKLPILVQELYNLGYLQDDRITNFDQIRMSSKQFIEDVLKVKDDVSMHQDVRTVVHHQGEYENDKKGNLLYEFLSKHKSRFHTDFENIGILGKGAFGAVYRAKHYLDKQEYAVKRIVFRFSDLTKLKKETDRVLREVRTVAALNHPHIVNYNQAWFEQYRQEDELTKDDVDFSDEEDEVSTQSRLHHKNQQPPKQQQQNGALQFHFDEDLSSDESSSSSSSDDDDGDDDEGMMIRNRHQRMEFTIEECNDDHSLCNTPVIGIAASPTSDQEMGGFEVKIRKASPEQLGLSMPEMTSDLENVMKHIHLDEGEYKNGKVRYSQVLYIQMQLCQSYTLENWLWESRRIEENVVDLEQVAKFVIQILSGIAHIHKKGLIHRDIKPANIFLTDDDVIKIGDFGLAKLAHTTSSNNHVSPQQRDSPHQYNPSDVYCSPPPPQNQRKRILGTIAPRPDMVMSRLQVEDWQPHTSDIGTPTYASPEQLKNDLFYNEKVDIYAFGILFFELLHPFQTRSERAACLEQLRSGQLDATFTEAYPEPARLILNCVATDPLERMSASHLLQEVRDIFKTEIANSPVKYMTDDGICFSPNHTPVEEGLAGSPPLDASLSHHGKPKVQALLKAKDKRIEELEAQVRALKQRMAS